MILGMNRLVIGLSVMLGVVIWLVVGGNGRAALPDLLIVEIQTASKTSASQELVGIANTTTKSTNLSGIRLEYFSANPKNITLPSRTFNLTGNLPAGQTYLLTSKDYLVDKSNQQYTATLAGAGGHLRLSSGVITSPTIYDFVGWGTATKPKGKAASAPAKGEILRRKKDSAGKYVYTGNNQADFELPPKPAQTPAPTKTSQPPGNTSATSKSSKSKSSLVGANTNFSGLVISELMPNPAKPLLDSKDEFIEIHNTTGRAINLAGLKVLTGKKLNHRYSFKPGSIGPGQYRALYVSVSKLTLSNSGGRVELRNPSDKIIGKAVVYDKAKDGLSYSLGGSWQWSSVATPGAKNIISLTGKTKSRSSSDAEYSEFGSGSIGQVKSATTNKASDEKDQQRPINSKIIAGVGSLGLLYGLYEYRTDIANLYHRLRGNRGLRAKDR
jgi:hypothetical protein